MSSKKKSKNTDSVYCSEEIAILLNNLLLKFIQKINENIFLSEKFENY